MPRNRKPRSKKARILKNIVKALEAQDHRVIVARWRGDSGKPRGAKSPLAMIAKNASNFSSKKTPAKKGASPRKKKSITFILIA